MATRSRKTEISYPYKVWNFNHNYLGYSPDINQTVTKSVTQDLVESHDNHWNRLRGKVPAVGADFHVVRRFFTETNSLGEGPKHFGKFPGQPLKSHTSILDGEHVYTVLAIDQAVSNGNQPMPYITGKLAMASLGSTAIARCLPTNPLANLSVTLGETLSEGLLTPVQLDSMKGKAAAARNAGSSYLNYSFGWAPMLRDLEKLCKSIKSFDKVLSKYIADSGKLLKVSYHFPDVENISETVNTGVYMSPSMLQILNVPSGTKTTYTIEKREMWFEGAFTYWLPQGVGGNIAMYSALANKVLGSRITPETLWALAPWSWATGWFSNATDVIHNVSAFQDDGLTYVRGFLMEKSSIERQEHLRGLSSITYGPFTLSRTRTTVSKQRVWVNPYTLGVFWNGLTSRQKATAVALGLARTSHHP